MRWSWVSALAASYLVGSVPTAYVLVRMTTGQDIRTIGSGNVGATNALRAGGRLVGVMVLLVDVLKGVVGARLVPAWLFADPSGAVSLACGAAAVIGHIAPCWLALRGGKGVATTFGVLLGGEPAIAGISAVVWAAVFVVCRYVSVASIAAGAAIPIGQALLRRAWPEVAIGAALALLIAVRHYGNLQRLLAGAEPREDFGKKH